MEWLSSIKQFTLQSDQVWVLYIFSIVFVTLFLSFLESRFADRLQKKLKETKSIWDDAFAWAVHKPFKYFIWLYGLTFAAQTAIGEGFLPFLSKTRQVGMVILVAWFFLRFTQKVEENYVSTDLRDAKLDKGAAQSIARLVRISIFITTGLLILQVLHIDVGPIIAFGGAGTVIMGFAAKDLLSNLFGALTIHLDRPFYVGDWIRSPDKNIEGTVEHIGWRCTRIRTFSKNPLYVPNSLFTTVAVENPSRMSNRRIKEIVGIRYQDSGQLAKITHEIQDMLKNHPEIDTTKACFVNLVSFGPSSLDLLVYTFTKTTQWIPFQGIKQDVMLKILEIIHNNGADVAFPTTTLDLPNKIKVDDLQKV